VRSAAVGPGLAWQVGFGEVRRGAARCGEVRRRAVRIVSDTAHSGIFLSERHGSYE